MNKNLFAANTKEKDKNNKVDSPKPTAYEGTKTANPAEKKKKRNKAISWAIIIAIFLGLMSLMFYSCFGSNVRYVNVYNASLTQSSSDSDHIHTVLNLNTDSDIDFEYSIDLSKNDNAQFETKSSAGSSTQYLVTAKSEQSSWIQFNLIRDAGSAGGYDDDVFYIGDLEITNATQYNSEFISWAKPYIANAELPSNEISIWYYILNLLPTLLIIGIMIWSVVRFSKMQSGMLGGGEESVFGMGKSQAKVAVSKVKFSDVAGIEEEKAELVEIVDYLKNPEKYAAMGARTPRGVILYGPPGTGKTLLAKAVAGEAKVPFFQISGSAFEDMLVGVGAKRVRDLFKNAKNAAPSIIFIDEIDSVASKRGSKDIAGGGGIADQTINQLLAEMDGFDTRTGIVVVAATNRLDVLDDAILRPGRFDRHVQINLPDIAEREAILKIHAANKNLSSKVVLNDIARRTPGFSGAQLENVLNEATLLAVRLKKTAIGMHEIDEAIDRVLAGPAKKSRVITPEEKKQIAYHEAGHALVGLHTKGSDVVEKITIIPRGYAAGYTLSTPEKQELAIQRKSDLLGMLRAILGGRAAEAVIYGDDKISTGASNDLYKVTNIAKAMVTQLGMSSVGITQFIPSEGVANPYASKFYSEQTAQKIDAEIEKIIVKEYKAAVELVKKNKKELDLIVDSLLTLETIVKKQIDYIHANLKLPNEVIEKKKANEAELKKAKASEVKEVKVEESKSKTKSKATETQPKKAKVTVVQENKVEEPDSEQEAKPDSK